MRRRVAVQASQHQILELSLGRQHGKLVSNIQIRSRKRRGYSTSCSKCMQFCAITRYDLSRSRVRTAADEMPATSIGKVWRSASPPRLTPSDRTVIDHQRATLNE